MAAIEGITELADLFSDDVFLQSHYMTMSEMFNHVNEINDCMRRLREVTTVNSNGDDYQSIINTLGPTLSAAFCKWIADGWAFDTKH